MHTVFDDMSLACPPTTGFPEDWTSAESRIDLGNLSLYTARYGGQDRTGRPESRTQNSTEIYRTSSQVRHPATRRLSSTAPAFVPANYTLPYDSGNALPQQDIGREKLLTTRRHLNPVTPKIDGGNLLTSSSTKAFHPIGRYDPQIYSPRSDMDGHWNELGLQPEFFSAQHRLLAETVAIYPSERFYSPACAIDRPSCATILPSVALGSSYLDALSPSNEAHIPALGLLQADTPPSSSLVRRRNLSHQQPRSIPLARLIQRRLSSVAEEDIADSSCSVVPSMSSNTARIKSCPETTDKTVRVKLPHALNSGA